ncbi:hypothetical protein D3C80_792720 [compost metagenome]
MIFKRNKRYLLYRILVSHFFIVILALSGTLVYEDIPFVWGITVFVPNLALSLVKNLSSVEIKEDHIDLTFEIYVYKKIIQSYKYDKLLFTYKGEYEGKSYSTLFRVYEKGNEKSIISIGGLVDGFYDNEIKEIIAELEKKGIEIKTK